MLHHQLESYFVPCIKSSNLGAYSLILEDVSKGDIQTGMNITHGDARQSPAPQLPSAASLCRPLAVSVPRSHLHLPSHARHQHDGCAQRGLRRSRPRCTTCLANFAARAASSPICGRLHLAILRTGLFASSERQWKETPAMVANMSGQT